MKDRMQTARYPISMTFLGILLLLSEIWKQWLLTTAVFGGTYCVWYFPFQLCSIPLYLCPLMVFLPEGGRHAVREFLMTFTLLGGILTFLDTTGLHYPLPALTIHSYLWHILLIGIGLWSGWDYRRETPIPPDAAAHRHCLGIWLACLGIATCLNLTLRSFGEINMFYISPYEASTQPVFREIAGRLGIFPSNCIYLGAMWIGAEILRKIWRSL